jgi:hypothetical protein
MPADEYGKFYFCVITVLDGGTEIYLNADEVSMEGDGSLVFRSAGRRKLAKSQKTSRVGSVLLSRPEPGKRPTLPT